MNSILPPVPEMAWGFGQAHETLDVPAITLDEFCEREKISAVHILKMDAQGAERQILQGAAKLLENSAIWLIYTEVLMVPLYENQPFLQDIITMLHQYDYQFFNIYHIAESRVGQARWADALFVSPNFRAQLVEKYGKQSCGW